MCAKNEFKKRDILYVSEKDKEKWRDIHQKSMLGFKHTAFVVRDEQEEDVCRAFPMNVKYAMNRIGKFVTVVVGEEVAMDKCDR